jgi:hypothetical protein
MRQGFGLYVTKTGHLISDEELDSWVAEAERGYDVERIRQHRVPIGTMREDTVESESSPGTYYHLKLMADGTWVCDCPGFQYRRECKHARRKQEEKPW